MGWLVVACADPNRKNKVVIRSMGLETLEMLRKKRLFLSRRTSEQVRLVELDTLLRTLLRMTRPRTGL